MAQSWGPQSHYHWGSEERSEKIKDYLTEGRTYVQRDLEDQIKEELEAKKINNSNHMSVSRPIVIQDVLDLLKKGYTRYSKDDRGFGSIQAHYNLTGVEVGELSRHPKLKQKKTVFPRISRLNIVDRDEPADTASQLINDVVTEQDVMVGTVNKDQLFS